MRSTFPEPDAPGAESLLNQISGQDRIEKEDCYAILASITDSRYGGEQMMRPGIRVVKKIEIFEDRSFDLL